MKLLVSAVLLLVLDSIFIYFMSKTFKSQVFDVQHFPLRVNMLGAALCYGFLIFGLYYFILRQHRPVLDAFLLGLVVYGVYETTSLALLKEWRWSTVLIDTLWGGVLLASTTYLTYALIK
jgi:uncharacterized membrane protein